MLGLCFKRGTLERQIVFHEQIDLEDPPREVHVWRQFMVNVIDVYTFNEDNPVAKSLDGKKGLRYEYSHNYWRH